MPPKKKAESGGVFDGLTFCISGTLLIGSKAEVTKMINTNGGSVAGTLTNAVTHLVTTEAECASRTEKLIKAKLKGVPIVDEDFIANSIAKGKLADVKKHLIGDEDAVAAPAPAAKKSKKAAAAPAEPAESAPAPKAAAKRKAEAAPEDSSTKVKVIRKGSAPVDQYSGLVNSGHVLEVGSVVYNVMLNQVNIGNNNNKFYVIQVIEPDSGGNYTTFTRWGRVGEPGQNAKAQFPTKEGAIAEFNKKFQDKTRNSWEFIKNNKDKFVTHSGKYTLIEMDYGDDPVKEEKKAAKGPAKTRDANSRLDKRVQDLVSLIFDIKMMEKTMVAMEYDVKKMPLGKLKQSVILKAYEVLKEIEGHLKSSSSSQRSLLQEASSRFYTLIPHSYPRHIPPPVISTSEMLKTKMQMLEALSDIEIATSMLEAAEDDDGTDNLLDLHYAKLKTDIEPVETSSKVYKDIQKYVTNTHQPNPPKIAQVYRIRREGEEQRFKAKKGLGNRQLLWHGSRLTNYVGIISQGLRIAPPEAPVSGYRFGKGVYFADMMSLSSRYCRTAGNKDFLMLLGDVALGKCAELPRDKFMTKPEPGTDSTHALGTIHPDPKDMGNDDGCAIPYGKPVSSGRTGVSCHENQFVVYDVAQCNLKYLLHLQQ